MISPCQNIPFKRGSTFAFKLTLPATVQDGQFLGWVPTAQIRKHRTDVSTSLIADVTVAWEDAATTRTLVIRAEDTAEWPLGLADFDVLLTKSDGTRLHSVTMTFDVQRSVTQ